MQALGRDALGRDALQLVLKITRDAPPRCSSGATDSKPRGPECVPPPLGKGDRLPPARVLQGPVSPLSTPVTYQQIPRFYLSPSPSSHSLPSAGPIGCWRPARRLLSPGPDGLQVPSGQLWCRRLGPSGNQAAWQEQQLASPGRATGRAGAAGTYCQLRSGARAWLPEEPG